MLKKTDLGLFELYRKHPDTADKLLFGRETNSDRRGFLKGAGLGDNECNGRGHDPVSPQHAGEFHSRGVCCGRKGRGQGRFDRSERPASQRGNAAAPSRRCDHPDVALVCPQQRHSAGGYQRKGWKLTIDGLVDTPMTLTIDDLKKKFDVVTKALVLECGGNGRAFHNPPAKGNQWTYGAVGCCEWTGVRLADVLKAAGVKKNVVYTAHEGADAHLSGTEGKLPISRGVPIEKAMNEHNLIAFAQNGADIHPMNGAPLRLVIPGWPGSCSQKWLKRIWLRDQVHDGPKMTGTAYRVPNRPVQPGEKVDKKDFVIIHAMPVKSLISHPATGLKTPDKGMEVRGHAWAGDRGVRSVTSRLISAPPGWKQNSRNRITTMPGQTGVPR